MRAKGADELAVGTNPLPFPGAGRSTCFGCLVHGTGLGRLFDAAAASKGSEDEEPRFDNIHKILDLIAGLFRRCDGRDERMGCGSEPISGQGRRGQMCVDDSEHGRKGAFHTGS